MMQTLNTEATQAPMTQEQYLAEPSVCPFCRSTDITGGGVTIDSGTAYQHVSCITCDKSWYDNYRLTGYEVSA